VTTPRPPRDRTSRSSLRAATAGAVVLTAALAGCTGAAPHSATTAPTASSSVRAVHSSTASATAADSPTSAAQAHRPVSLHPGAAVLAGDVSSVPKAALVPSPATAAHDLADYDRQGCQVSQTSRTVKTCTFGVRTAPKLTIAVVGDSVAGEWMPALEQIAAERKWKIVTMLHSRCPFSATMTVNSGESVPYETCHDWGAAALQELLTDVKPAVVITSDRPSIGTVDHAAHTSEALADIGAGMATYWRTLISHGIAVVAIQESPETGINQPDCLRAHNDDPGPCTVARADAVINDPPTVVAAREVPAAHLVNMNSLICGKDSCSPIVGNVLVYRDTHHLTVTYSRTTAPYLDRKLQRIPALR
jgi:hypothetical protein